MPDQNQENSSASNVSENNSDANQENSSLNSQDTFHDKVSATLKGVTRKPDGGWNFPDNTSEEIAYAVTAELRRRDTQAEFTRTRQKQVALEAEKQELLKQLSTTEAKLELTDKQKEELEELKFSSPEDWHKKLKSYENSAQEEYTKKVNEQLKEISANGTREAELERRKLVLKEFQNSNPETVIDDDVIANDVPPRITRKLQENAISFEQFLQEVADYIKANKVIVNTEKTLNEPNLSKTGGSETPSADAIDKASKQSYENEIY